MQELRLIFGWLIQIVGMLLFPIAVGEFFFLAGFQSFIQGTLYRLSFSPISLQQNPTVYIPLAIFLLAILLTWIGLRLRRDL